MRRIYTFLATAILLIAGATSVSAKDYWITAEEPSAEITAGQVIVLKGAQSNQYLAGAKLSAIVSDDCLFQFVAGEDKDGYKTWYLQQVTTKMYVSQAAGGMTSDFTQATNYFVEPAVAYETVAEIDAAEDGDINGTLTTCQGSLVNTEGAFVFTNTADRKTHMNLYAGSLCFYNYDDTNASFIYEVNKAEGIDKLRAVMADLFPNDRPVNEIFTEGTLSGQVPPAYYQALVQARETADNLIYNTVDPSAADCEAAAKALEEAYNAAQDNIVTLSAGFYRFKTTAYSKENGYAYTDGTSIYWAQDAPYEIPEKLATDDAAYIWEFIPTSDVRGGYYIRNVRYNQYIQYYNKLSESQQLSDEPTSVWIVEPAPSTANAFVLRAQTDMNQGLHAAAAGSFVVRYTYTGEASAWALESVAEADVNALAEGVKQAQLNDALTATLNEAINTRENGYERLPITLTEPQIWSNAPEATEGHYPGAIDVLEDKTPDYSTIFHSSWSASVDVPYHNFIVDLGQAVDAARFEIANRCVGTYNQPKVIDVYAAKEIAVKHVTGSAGQDSIVSDSLAGDSWVKIGQYTLNYDRSIVYNGETKENWMAQLTVPFGDEYRYFRMDVVDARNVNGSKTKFFNFSNISFYGQIDEAKSINTTIPAEYTTPLNEAIKKAQAEVKEGKATQATIDALEKALKLYEDNYPDPDVLRALLDEVKMLAAGISSEKPETPGYFAEGVSDAINERVTAIDEQMPEDAMFSFNQVAEYTNTLKAIMADIHKAVVKPADGFYRIVSMSTNDERKGNLIYPAGSGESALWWTGSRENVNMPSDLGYIWQLTNNEDGTVTLRNLFSGYYMGKVEGDELSVQNHMSKEAVNIPLEFSGTAGTLNIVQDTNRYLNTDPNGKIVTWSERGDNSLFRFAPEEESAWEGAHFISAEAGLPTVITLPFEISNEAIGGMTYEMLGFNKAEGTVELVEAQSETFPAGTPFVIIVEDESEGIYVMPTAGEAISDMAQATFTDQPLSGNGLVGVLASDTLSSKQLKFAKDASSNLTVTYLDANSVLDPNTGYLTLSTIAEIDTKGDLSISLSNDVLTGVQHVVANAQNGKKAIYDLSGRRVQKLSNKGLYIINGKKVLVK